MTELTDAIIEADKVRGVRAPSAKKSPADPQEDKTEREKGEHSYVEVAAFLKTFIDRLEALAGYAPQDPAISITSLRALWAALDAFNESIPTTSQVLADATATARCNTRPSAASAGNRKRSPMEETGGDESPPPVLFFQIDWQNSPFGVRALRSRLAATGNVFREYFPKSCNKWRWILKQVSERWTWPDGRAALPDSNSPTTNP